MIIKKAFFYRLKPKKAQLMQFANFSGACRYIYNRGLEERKKAYEEENKSLRYFDQNLELTRLKKEEKTNWLKDIHSQILQQALKDLNQSFENFFRRVKQKQKPGYPRFKSKGIRDTFRYPQGVKIKDDTAYLPKIGWVKFRKTREVKGTLKQTTISRRGDHWYISFSCEIEIEDPPKAAITEEKAIGIDLGLIHYGVLASGKENKHIIIPPPKFLKNLLPRMRILSKRLSRKQKGSNNWKKAKNQLTKLHAKIRHARENFAHQLSTAIVKSHDIICVESLNIEELLQKKELSRAIADAGWRQFLRYLKYKAHEKGKHFVEAGKYYPSTQLCSSCGHKAKISLKERKYDCKNCGLQMDRDYNSSIVIKAAGMTVLKACGAT
jgi:putative transposase